MDPDKPSITQIVASHIVRCRVPGPCIAGVNASLLQEPPLDSHGSQTAHVKDTISKETELLEGKQFSFTQYYL